MAAAHTATRITRRSPPTQRRETSPTAFDVIGSDGALETRESPSIADIQVRNVPNAGSILSGLSRT